MDITARIIDHEPVEFTLDGVTIPLVVGWTNGRRETAAELASRPKRDPATCDHAGAAWSPNLALRCAQCGAPMFLPPPLLAYLNADLLADMDELWCAAGWPEWDNPAHAWRTNAQWTRIWHPYFSQCDGIPVRNDRTELFNRALAAVEG